MLPREKGSSPQHNPFDERCTARAEDAPALLGETCTVCSRELLMRAALNVPREVGS